MDGHQCNTIALFALLVLIGHQSNLAEVDSQGGSLSHLKGSMYIFIDTAEKFLDVLDTCLPFAGSVALEVGEDTCLIDDPLGDGVEITLLLVVRAQVIEKSSKGLEACSCGLIDFDTVAEGITEDVHHG